MPTLPRSDLPRVTATPLPRPQATAPPAAAFGAGLGEAVADVGAVLGRLALEERRKAQGVALTTFEKDVGTWELESLHHPQTGALSKQGRNALELSDPEKGPLAAFDKWAEQQLEGIADPTVRARAEEIIAQRRQAIGLSVMRHEANERERVDVDETAAAVDTAAALGIAHYRDPVRRDGELQKLSILIRERGARAGWSDEQLGSELRKAWTSFHRGVIASYLDAEQPDPEGARAYLETVREEIDARELDDIEKAVGLRERLTREQREADAIVERFGLRGDDADVAGAMGAVRKLDGELRDKVHARVLSEIRERSYLEQVEVDGWKADALEVFDATGNVDKIPAGLRARLEANAPGFVSALEREQARRRGAGSEPATNWDVWTQFMELSKADRAKLTAADLRERYRPHLSDDHFKQLTTAWSAARESVASGATGAPDPLTWQQRFLATAREHGLAPQRGDKWKPEQSALFERLSVEAADRLAEAEGAKGGKLGPEDRQRILDELIIEQRVVRRGRMWGTRGEPVPLAAVPESDRADYVVPFERVPREFREAWRNVAIGRGLVGDELDVGSMHRAYLEGDPELRALAERLRAEPTAPADNPWERGPSDDELARIRAALTTADGPPSDALVLSVWREWATEAAEGVLP